MNSLNSTNSTEYYYNFNFEKDYILNILYTYFYPVPAVFGVFLSFINTVVFFSNELKGDIFSYLLWKSIFETFFALINSFSPFGFCPDCFFTNSYGFCVYRLYFFSVIVR